MYCSFLVSVTYKLLKRTAPVLICYQLGPNECVRGKNEEAIYSISGNNCNQDRSTSDRLNISFARVQKSTERLCCFQKNNPNPNPNSNPNPNPKGEWGVDDFMLSFSFDIPLFYLLHFSYLNVKPYHSLPILNTFTWKRLIIDWLFIVFIMINTGQTETHFISNGKITSKRSNNLKNVLKAAANSKSSATPCPISYYGTVPEKHIIPDKALECNILNTATVQ